jgi:hypothetical protein
MIVLQQNKHEKPKQLPNIVIYKTKNGPELEVNFKKEKLWVTLNQIALLFGVQKSVISKHIKNIFESEELSQVSTVSKMGIVQK